ncbi:Ribonuclease VapC37 [Mycobacterium talmoniae]|uniref:Ribonuclease VapC37 n=1 Tax=Mycobacterium talmoniae TaxID=1858794 RepID=A0A2S8BD25_9MYCO|nr:Ribonuclease VapC37 [Mycobacterium talmoniae]
MPLLAFTRLSTKEGLFPDPLRPAEAAERLADWLAAPSAVLVNPTARHVEVFTTMLGRAGSGGNLVNDAHLAALAVEHRAGIVSYDGDFDRFGVGWDRPGELLGRQGRPE